MTVNSEYGNVVHFIESDLLGLQFQVSIIFFEISLTVACSVEFYVATFLRVILHIFSFATLYYDEVYSPPLSLRYRCIRLINKHVYCCAFCDYFMFSNI